MHAILRAHEAEQFCAARPTISGPLEPVVTCGAMAGLRMNDRGSVAALAPWGLL